MLSFVSSGRSVGPLFLMMESYVAFTDSAIDSLRSIAIHAGHVREIVAMESTVMQQPSSRSLQWIGGERFPGDGSSE
ncbi:hypothetical protein ACGFX2_23410 [Streptomyces goshikiensis]|uniref:hypothetical protein n=1 Tax=Streptomyces goshikiensis TaxID=1942 RepID=UPI003716BDD3